MKRTDHNISISSINSSQSPSEKNRKIQKSISEISMNDMNCSFNRDENHSIKYKNPQKTNFTTNDNNISDSIYKKKRKLNRKLDSSKLNNSNDTSFRNKINESSITGKDYNNEFITNQDNSFAFKDYGYVTTEEKLRNLVKQTKRTSKRPMFSRTEASKLNDDFDFILTSNVNNLLCQEGENSKNIIEIKDHTKYSNFELSKILFDLITNAKNNVLVILPPRYISFPNLIILNNIKIKGSPGTLVEINNGCIVVKNKNVKISISECSFVLNIETKSFIEKLKCDEVLKSNVQVINGKYHISLFHIREETFMEVNDCDFRAIVHEEESLLEENDNKRKIYESCFTMHNLNMTNSQLILQSTIFSNFCKILDGINLNNVTISHCHFSDTFSHAIYLQNTINFTFTNCTISNTESAIELFYDKNFAFSKIDDEVKIKITESDISQTKNRAICLHSENEFQNIFPKIEIKKNLLKGNKNGITLNKLMFYLFEIIGNEIKNNFESGICITKTQINNKYNASESYSKLISKETESSKFYPEFNLVAISNSIIDNKNNIGIRIENCCNLNFKCEEEKYFNNLGGMSLKNNSNSLIYVKNCQFFENFDNGFYCSDTHGSTKIFITNSRFLKNFAYGLCLSNDKTQNGIASINIKNSEISNNKMGGIYFKNFAVSIENSKIIDNTKWAVEIAQESDKELIKLVNYDPSLLNANINNSMGGSWGVIENKKSICANGCSIL